MAKQLEEHEYFKSDGQLIYDYNKTTDVLRVNPRLFTKGEIDFLDASLKDRPTGSGLGISKMPIGTVVFHGLKKITSLALEETIL